MWRLAVGMSIVALGGCVLVPNSVRPEIEHFSHVTQHEPFAATPTGYYSDVAAVALHWDTPGRTFVEVADGVEIGPGWKRGPNFGYGEMQGPREEFELRVGAVIPVRR